MFCMDAQFVRLTPVRLTLAELINWLPVLVLTIIHCLVGQWLVEQWDGRLIIVQSILYMHAHSYTCTRTNTITHPMHTLTQKLCGATKVI